MTTIAESDNSNNVSWLKQRSTIFNNGSNSNTTATNTPPKVVDKELARLKNMGAVSSVWSNKFVQEDNSGGNNSNFRSSMTSPPPRPTSPRSPTFNNRARTLSGNNKKLADDINAALEQQQTRKNSSGSVNNLGYFSKASMSSLDLNDCSEDTTRNSMSKSVRSSVASTSTTSTASVPSSPVNQVAPTSPVADNTILPTPSPKGSPTNSISSVTPSIDEAASLWFQCETIKTQYAQSNARLNRANEDIEFYKRQLEQQAEVTREGIASAMEEKEKESLRVRQLAELIVKQDKLLGEYEINLDCLTRLTDESAYLEETQAEMDGLREELVDLQKKKLEMEGSIAALRAELEMSRSQMLLMMAVSTEIQNEFACYKGKIDAEVREMMSVKNRQHQLEVQALQEKITSLGEVNNSAVADRSMGVNSEKDQEEVIAKHVAAATAAAAFTAAGVAAENEKALASLVDKITDLTETLHQKDVSVSQALENKDNEIQLKNRELLEKENAYAEALKAKDQVIQEALEGKDQVIADLEKQLKAQKMNMDSRMMELNQTILEKDNLLMEFMSSRNNSREVISAAASMASSSIPPASVTNTYYHSNQSEAQLQMSEIRNYILSSSSSDEDEDEATEVLTLSYSTDEEDTEQQHQQQYDNHYRHVLATEHRSTPQSPAETVSSSISFDSDDEEEEKVAEIKRFSYNSVQSQTTRPISLTESLSSSTGRNSIRNSNPAPFNVVKESSTASWPMPPPTPPPSEPLPPVPSIQTENTDNAATSTATKEEVNKPTSPIAQLVSTVPPPRRARSKTMARDEVPDMSKYTTSIHQTNELPRIIPLQEQQKFAEEDSLPVPPPRKDLPSLNIIQANSNNAKLAQQKEQHTKWMDDPESEEDEWCEANAITTPKQQQHHQPQEWNIM
ncbi:unnamed protein product [Mucor hiemalis]